jgi:hypothetical protein
MDPAAATTVQIQLPVTALEPEQSFLSFKSGTASPEAETESEAVEFEGPEGEGERCVLAKDL